VSHFRILIAVFTLLVLLLISALVGTLLYSGQKQSGITSVSMIQPRATIPADSVSPGVKIQPELNDSGGVLIFSDNPEYLFANISFPIAMYRSNATGEFRVFYHHVNDADRPLSIGVAITNIGFQTVDIYVRGHGWGISIYPDVAGQNALRGWFLTEHNFTLIATLQRGQSLFMTNLTQNGETVSGIEDFSAIAKDSNVTAEVEITVLAFNGTEEPNDPTQVPISVPTQGSIKCPVGLNFCLTGRGTFPYYNRFGVIELFTGNQSSYLVVDSSPPGLPYSEAMRNEYIVGYDFVDHLNTVDVGNYGIIYYFKIMIYNTLRTNTICHLLMEPTGGFGHYIILVREGDAITGKENLLVSPFLDYRVAWLFGEISLKKGEDIDIYIVTALPGGSYGPQELIFSFNLVPVFT
jgi:hypothetical protein